MNLKFLAIIAISPFPWFIRRRLLEYFFDYSLHPSASISRISLIAPDLLVMKENSKIGALTVAINIRALEMGVSSSIGRKNWITGHEMNSKRHFSHVKNRDPSLYIGSHSAITRRHLIDCSDTISVGDFTTIAGYDTQLLTHGIDYLLNRQHCAPISIGSHCIIGTRAVFLSGSSLPDNSILGACSLVNKSLEQSFCLYAGVPATHKKSLPRDARYFSRERGFVE